MNLFIPGDSKYLTLCEVEVYGEGEIKQSDLVFCQTKTIVKLSISLFHNSGYLATFIVFVHKINLCLTLNHIYHFYFTREPVFNGI